MSSIGILGGLSYQSTIYYYRLINELYYKSRGEHPEIVIESISLERFSGLLSQRRYDEISELLINSLNRFSAYNISAALIASNTPHFILNRILDRIKVPMISILDSVRSALQKDERKKVVLLGTAFTMNSEYYKDFLYKSAIEVMVPSQEDIRIINTIIFEELALGIFRKESGEIITGIITRLLPQGIDGVILGCTELPLLLGEEVNQIQLYNTSELHCRFLMNYLNLEKNNG
ncbi:MAG: amino acid racemase [bacterium]|nr:amino acid racemase [bacterium]